jgi:hypothetical protein
MKTRLNLTIEDALLKKMKYYAQKHHTSVSELVEVYFKKITNPSHQKNIIELVDELEKPAIDENADLKELYFKAQGKKYGI